MIVSSVQAWHAEQARLAAAGAQKLAVEERNQKEEQRRLAEEAKTWAEKRRAETSAVLDFVQERILAAARPEKQDGGLGREVKLIDAIRASLPALESNFKDQPLIEAQLRNVIGLSFAYLGEFTTADAMFRRAVELYSTHLGPDHLETLRSRNNVALALCEFGRHAEALPTFEDVLARRREKLGSGHPSTCSSMNCLAMCYTAMGRQKEALRLLEEAVANMKGGVGPDNEATLNYMNSLANCYGHLGRHDEAIALYTTTLEKQRRILGVDHPATLTTQSNFAYEYAATGKHEEALRLQLESLRARESKMGPEHADTLGSMNSVALAFDNLGRHDEAQETYSKLIKRLDAKLQQHPELWELAVMQGGACCNLGSSLMAAGKTTDALPWFAKGQARLQSMLEAQPNSARARLFLRNIFWTRAEADERLSLYADADADWNKASELSAENARAGLRSERQRYLKERPMPETAAPTKPNAK